MYACSVGRNYMGACVMCGRVGVGRGWRKEDDKDNWVHVGTPIQVRWIIPESIRMVHDTNKSTMLCKIHLRVSH